MQSPQRSTPVGRGAALQMMHLPLSEVIGFSVLVVIFYPVARHSKNVFFVFLFRFFVTWKENHDAEKKNNFSVTKRKMSHSTTDLTDIETAIQYALSSVIPGKGASEIDAHISEIKAALVGTSGLVTTSPDYFAVRNMLDYLSTYDILCACATPSEKKQHTEVMKEVARILIKMITE
jgi:hypothetical protein